MLISESGQASSLISIISESRIDFAFSVAHLFEELYITAIDSSKNMTPEPVLIDTENLLHYSSRILLIKQTF